jgi:hypothetical protein
MEFLDPKKQKAHLVRLIIGYVLISIALVLTTIILLYQAYGFGIRNGEVIQNGLIFVSSRPNPADIYVNGQKREETTNSRLLLPAGQYKFELQRDGYRNWKRAISIEGGSVGRFDYPFLFPTKLTTTTTKKYEVKPNVVTQSPDQRWMLVQTGDYNNFDLYDTKSPQKAATALTLPTNLFTLTSGVHSWKFVEWASDNRHVLLQHMTDANGTKSSEYILVDREEEDSVNLTKLLGSNPDQIELRNKKFDKYFLFNKEAQTLTTASIEEPAAKPFLDHVLAFKSHGDKTVMYASNKDVSAGKTAIREYDDGKTYTFREVTAGDTYLIDFTQYSGDWYVALGAPAENKVYVYQNPISKLKSKPKDPLVPVQVLKVHNPNYISFSANARFIVAENGTQFALYDAETDKGYAYTLKQPMDAPQTHATWMDGHRMMYVSGGKVFVFEFDDANHETLQAADPSYAPLFNRDYEVMYSFANRTEKAENGTTNTMFALTATDMLTERDQ